MARSTLELLLDRLNGKDEGNVSDDIPPSLPQRPLSKARLPSKRKRVSDLLLNSSDMQEDIRREVRRFKKDLSAEQKIGTSLFTTNQVEDAENISANCERILPQNGDGIPTENVEETVLRFSDEANKNSHKAEHAAIEADVVSDGLTIPAQGLQKKKYRAITTDVVSDCLSIPAQGIHQKKYQSSELDSVSDRTDERETNKTETVYALGSAGFTNPEQRIKKNCYHSSELISVYNETEENKAHKTDHQDGIADVVLHGLTTPKQGIKTTNYHSSDVVSVHDETIESKSHRTEHEDGIAIVMSHEFTTPREGTHKKGDHSYSENEDSKKDNQKYLLGVGMVETINQPLSSGKKDNQHYQLKDAMVEQCNHQQLSFGKAGMIEKGSKDISSNHKDNQQEQYPPPDARMLASSPQQLAPEVQMSETDDQSDVSLSCKKRKRGDLPDDSGSAKKQRKEHTELPVPVPMTMPVPDICTGIRKHRREISRFFSRLFRRR